MPSTTPLSRLNRRHTGSPNVSSATARLIAFSHKGLSGYRTSNRCPLPKSDKSGAQSDCPLAPTRWGDGFWRRRERADHYCPFAPKRGGTSCTSIRSRHHLCTPGVGKSVAAHAAFSGKERRQALPYLRPWYDAILREESFGFQHQPPLSRRLVPNAFAGVWRQGRLHPIQWGAPITSRVFPSGRSGGWFWHHEP
jgi:hypothetical protein